MKKRVLSLFMALTLCLTLLPTSAFAEGENSGIGSSATTTVEDGQTTAAGAPVEDGNSSNAGAAGEGNDQPADPESVNEGNGQSTNTGEGEQPNSETDTRTEIWCVSKPDSIGRSYDGTTDGGRIPINLTFTDGTNEIEFKEGTDFSAVKTFDSADAGWHKVTVEITLIGEAAAKYKLKAGEEKFEIGGNINKAYPDLTVSLSRATCAVGEKLLPLLSVEGAPEDAAVTYYYTQYKTIAGDSEFEGSDAVPKIDENTVIDKLDEEGNNTYYVYARTAATHNYQEGMSNVLEFTVAEKVDPVASVTSAAGTETTYGSFLDAWTAAIANNGSTLKLLADATLPNTNTDLGQSLTLDLNGYVLGSNGSLTVKNGAALTVRNAGAENLEKPVKAGLYLTLLVEKGGSFTCTDGGLRYLGLLSAGTGDYAIQLAEGESHCTFGGFAQGDESATAGDLLKATPGMALYGDYNGSDVRIERSTRISSGFTYLSFYVGPCSEHQMDANGTCIYCGASYVASVTTNGGVTTNYTSLDDALDAVKDGDTITLLSDVDLGETYVTIGKSITFDLNGKTLSSSKAWLDYGVLVVKDATVTVKNGKVKAAEMGSCAIRAYGSGASMTLEDVTATVTSGESSVMVGNFGSAVIKSGDYQGLYVGAKSQVTLEGGTFRPYMDTITTNENVKSIFWQVNETTDTTSRDCMELLGDGCVYVDETETQVRTGGGFNTVVTVQQGTAIDAPVAKIGDVEYASLSKAINAVQNGGTITLLNDLDLGNGAVLQVGSPRKNFTIDLASHTLSADGDCLIMLHNGSQLTLKNGTLDGSRCTSYEGVLYISSNSGPKLTLENVTAKNVQRSVPLVYVTNGTVEFDGGSYTGGVLVHSNGNAVLKNGTFQKGNNTYSIKTDVSGKQLSNYLDGESLFWKDNAPLDLSSATETADEVTVRPCKHNWENGKCTVCQKVCDHGSADGKSMTEDPCPTCGMKAAAQVDITGSATKYFLSFNGALVYAYNNDGCTLKLLADVTEAAVMINNPFLFDLNGHNVGALSVDARATIKDSGTEKGKIGKVTVSNDKVPDLTLGDLLEEGYAFKSSSGNKWYFGVENAITNVTVQPVPIKSVTAEHPTVTVEYGKTSGVTLTATAVLATEGGTVSYQWYKIGGTDFPIQDATKDTYQLPADLGAGTHTYRLTATSDGYPKSVDITVNVTPISLEGATVTVKDLTYNGQKQFPTVTVKLDENTTLTKNTDFDVDATMQTNAGSYTLTVNGNGNYSGKIENVEWKIEPFKITNVMVLKNISKVYDGTADITKTAEDWAGLLSFNWSPSAGSANVPSSAYTISDAAFAELRDGECFASPDAGKKDGITFKITLKSQNYVLQADYDEGPETSKAYFQDSGANFTITQGSINTSSLWLEQHVFNDLAKTYEIDLKTLLPELGLFCEYGDITYGAPRVTFTDTAYQGGDATLTNGVLRLPIASANTSKNEIGTVTIEVNSTNYQTFKLTLHVIADDKIVLDQRDVAVSASEITYGQTLADSTLTATGSMICPRTNKAIPGTFAWTDGTIKPNAGDYTASWTFTPAAGYEEYATVTGSVTVKVKPAKLTVSVKASSTYYTGKPQYASIIASGQSVDSTPVTFTYSDKVDGNYTSDGPTFTDAGTYTAYYKAEAANHEPATGTFTVTIDPLPISLLSIERISKSYDGSANVTLSADMLTFISKTAKASNIKLPDTALTFSSAQFTKEQADGSYLPSPEVGGGKVLSFAMTLESGNYVFESKKEDPKTIDIDYATGDATKFTITKADAPTATAGTLNVINGTTLDYTFDFNGLLPTLSDPKTYGAVSYTLLPFTFSKGYYFDSTTTGLKDGELLLASLDATGATSTGEIGTITVKVSTGNYEDFTLTLNLYAVDKIAPVVDGGITASDITYGQTLSESSITGKMKDPDTGDEVKGTFTWKAPDATPDAGSYEAEWTFTPDAPEYAAATGKVTVKVNKAASSVVTAPVANTLTYNGSERTLVSAGTAKGGTMQYRLGNSGEFSTEIPKATDVGTYTVYYMVAGDSNHNDTAEQQPITVTIDPMKLSRFVLGIDSLTKAYDGTASASFDKREIEFRSNGAIVSLPEDAYDITNARFTVRADGNYKDSPEAGDGKSLSFTVTLKSDNYVFEGDGESKTLDCNIVAEDAKSFTITKATAPAAETGSLTITNGLHKTYFLDLSTLLQKLTAPCDYGTITYDKKVVTDLGVGTFITLVNGKTGELTLEANRSGTDEGQFGTITVTISTGNYQDITLTINVSAKNKLTPVLDGMVTLTPAKITYGEPLSKIKITGTMKDPDTGATVEGTFSWQQPGDTILDASTLGHTVEWKFTPQDENTYMEATGTATVKVDRARQYGKVSMAGYTYGQTPSTPTLTDRTGDANAQVTYRYSATGSGSVQTWDIQNPPALNAGTFHMLAQISQTDNYYGYDTAYCEFVVAKATPAYTKPTGLTAEYGQTLAEVKLPDGWSWMNSSEAVGDASTSAKTFKAKFTPTDTKNYNTVENIELEVTVNKADGSNLKTVELTQKYTDTSEHTYTPDWSELPTGQKWSYNSEYSVSTGSTATPTKQDFAADGSLLTYAISGGKAGDTVTITLKASCNNYEDFTITLTIALTKKDDQKPLTITGDTSVVYGEKLTLTTTGGSGTGAVTYRIDTAYSTGEATINPETGVLTPVKVGSVSVIATKAGDKDYNDVTSAPFVLMIKPATPTGEPKYTKITTSGKTLKDAALTTSGSTLKPNDGKLEWVDDKGNVLPDDTSVEVNTTYKWRFTPTNANYTTLTGEVELYHKSSSGGGGWYESYYTIKATASAGGSISPYGSVSVREGRDQTFTITPDKGYAVSNVKIDGKSIGAVKSYTFENVSRTHTIEVIFMKANGNPQTGVFVDVATGSYYEDAVDWAVENGITQGTDDTHFAPDGICTRAQAVTFLWRAAGSPEPETRSMPFADVPAGSYYYNAVLWAVENGITKGTSDTTFSPNMTCSRAQIVTFLWRAEKSPAAGTDNPFADVKSIAYYADAVLWAVKENITAGTTTTTFSPDANCTRAQIVTFLWRCKK